jgi:hypothetical protein
MSEELVSDQSRFPEEHGSVDHLDLSGRHIHGLNLTGAKLTDVDLSGAEVGGEIEGLRINGVEVAPLVAAELDRRFPERVKLRAADVEGLRDAWSMLEGLWAGTTERAARLPEELQQRQVNGEWSFLETLRHLIFATDCWLNRAVLQVRHAYHPWGLPWTGVPSAWVQVIGLDVSAAPGLTDLVPVRQGRQRAVRTTLEGLDDDQLAEIRSAPDDPGYPNGDHTVLQCFHVLLNEEWEHHRYAVRDLDVLDPRSGH